MARHRYAVQLRWSDLDVRAHVNNVQYLRFLEDARVQMLVHLGRPGEMMETGQVTVRHEIRFRLSPISWRSTRTSSPSRRPQGDPAAFTKRFQELRAQHQRKPSLPGRFDKAGVPR